MPPSRGNRRGRPGRSGRPSNPRHDRRPPRASAPPPPFSGPPVINDAPPASLPRHSVAVLWLRNDLRVRDNPALALANTASALFPVYVFDASQYGPDHLSPHGFQRTGPFRAVFQVEAVRDMQQALRRCGSDLLVRQGDPAEELLDAMRKLAETKLGGLRVVAQKEVTWEEVKMEDKVEKGVRELGEEFGIEVDVHWVWGSTLHHLDDLPFNAGGPAVPSTFTEYRKIIEANGGPEVRPEVAIPQKLTPYPGHLMIPSDPWPSLRVDLQVDGLCEPMDNPFPSPLACIEFEGGPRKGEQRLDEYLFKMDALQHYKETRNESGTRDGSSKFSPWLALGCLSPRTIYWECKKYERERVANESTYWMVFELMTRDYFRWVAASVGTKLFAWNGYSGRGSNERSLFHIDYSAFKPHHKVRFEKWVAGQTGAPFVDANMRELANTGFMSNRGRQNVASFLIHDLEYPDWRAGAEYFESKLIDHDVASNWANWAYLAGVGSDPRGGRKFNVIKQAMQYDEDGWYTTRWCPELVQIPAPYIHEPYTLSKPEQEDLGVILGKDYPEPIVRMPKPPVKKR